MRSDPRGAYYTPQEIVRLIVEETVGRLRWATDEIAVLDPACGDGAFLIGARRYAPNTIYGVDLDEVALSRARESLPNANLVLGDSLLDVDWLGRFPRVMSSGGFDAVIGNPPWVSLAGRFGIPAYDGKQVERLRARFGGNSYMPNLFEYFVALGLELTRPGGYFSFIVPDRLGFNRQFEPLRRRMLTETELLLVVHGIRFPGVVADTMVFVCRNCAPPADAVTELRDSGGLSSIVRQSELIARDGCVFPRPEDPRLTRIIERIKSAGGRMLGEVCEITSGFGGRSGLITEERASDSQIPILKGEGIERYVVRRAHWFDFRREHLTGRTCDRAKLGASPKVLVRKTGNSLIAAYDDSDRYPEQSLYFLFGFRDVDPFLVLGLLNSRLMNLYYRARCLTNPRTIAHAKRSDLMRIPLPPLDSSRPESREIVGLVRRMIAHGEDADSQATIDRLVCQLYGVEMQDLWAVVG